MGKTITYDKDKFKALFDQGLTYEEIGNHFGAGPTWVCRTVKALGIKRKKQPVKVTWDITPNGAIDDNVRKLVDKRNGILIRFLETGDTSEAEAYCAKYKVPRPDGKAEFRQFLESAAGRLQRRQVAVKPKKRRGGRKPKFTEEQLQEQFDNGCTVEEAAANLGCSTVTIWKRRKEWGLTKPKQERKGRPKNTWTQLDKDELQKLCDQGLSIERIAREMDVGITIVKRNIKEYGIERKSLRKALHIDKEQLRKMVEEDRMIAKDIAKKIGCYPNTVNKLAKKYGIKKPPKAAPEPSDQDPVVLPEDEPFKLNLTLRPEAVRELNILLRKHEGKRPGEVVRIALHEQAKILRKEERKTWSGRAGKYKFIDGQWQKVKEDS